MSAGDSIAQPAPEVPVALVYNGISHAVMMASPGDLHDFAIGFSFTEGVISATANILDIETNTVENGIELQIAISNRCMESLRLQRRSMAGRSGCGICGSESLDLAVREPAVVAQGRSISTAAIHRAVDQLTLWRATGERISGLHRAAWCDALSGELITVRQDVGRHNALDKLIGALLQARTDISAGFILLSSRASYEMVQKTAMLGVSTLVAVSAATTLAIAQADKAGMSLIAQARNNDFRVLTHPQRITA